MTVTAIIVAYVCVESSIRVTDRGTIERARIALGQLWCGQTAGVEETGWGPGGPCASASHLRRWLPPPFSIRRLQKEPET